MVTGSLHLNRDIILANKRHTMSEREKHTPIEAVTAMAQFQNRPRHLFDMVLEMDHVLLIGQVTRRRHYDPVMTALRWVHAGASAVAFFTDNVIYPYDLDDLLIVARGVPETPVLYQNYILTPYGVMSARAADASAAVFYSDILTNDQLRNTVSLAQRYKLSTIIQVSNPRDLERANQLSPHAISFGDTLSRNVDHSIKLLNDLRADVPAHSYVLLSQALTTIKQVEQALTVGVQAIIISEDILNDDDQLAALCQLMAC